MELSQPRTPLSLSSQQQHVSATSPMKTQAPQTITQKYRALTSVVVGAQCDPDRREKDSKQSTLQHPAPTNASKVGRKTQPVDVETCQVVLHVHSSTSKPLIQQHAPISISAPVTTAARRFQSQDAVLFTKSTTTQAQAHTTSLHRKPETRATNYHRTNSYRQLNDTFSGMFLSSITMGEAKKSG